MGGEGTIAGMITALRNNAKMRLKRKRFFSVDRNPQSHKHIGPAKKSYVKRSPEEIRRFREKLKIEKRRQMIKIILAFVATMIIGGILFYFMLIAVR